jgi:ABC-type dipeptide/oligopeptide/nickel transport system permease component
MGRYIIRRLFYLLVVLLTVSAITFGLMHAVPGGPFTQEKALPPATIEILEEHYNLNDPLIVQYGRYLSDVMLPKISTTPPGNSIRDDALLKFNIGKVYVQWMNFGPSYAARNRSVNDIFRDQLPVSMQLGVLALCVALLVGLPLGTIAALKQNTILDYLGMSVAIFGVSVPVIVLGPILIWIFGVTLKWLPPSGWGAKPPYTLFFLPSELSPDYFKYALMPAVALGMGGSAIIARLTRASLLQVIREDYIRTARAKGLKERAILIRHALKNAMIPVVTILGPMFASLVTGTFVTELTFGIPGMGRYFVTSITNRDYPVIMGTILLYAVFLVIANLLVDIVYGFLDPRISYN